MRSATPTLLQTTIASRRIAHDQALQPAAESLDLPRDELSTSTFPVSWQARSKSMEKLHAVAQVFLQGQVTKPQALHHRVRQTSVALHVTTSGKCSATNRLIAAKERARRKNDTCACLDSSSRLNRSSF